MRDKYVPGDWNVICDATGQKVKASQAKKRWDGMWVVPEHWEERHPMDFLRVNKDKQKVPDTRNTDDAFESSPVQASDL